MGAGDYGVAEAGKLPQTQVGLSKVGMEPKGLKAFCKPRKSVIFSNADFTS